jgi:hypothetical protein
MHIKGLIWLGLRTAQFEEMEKFSRDVMGMEVIREEAELVRFRPMNHAQVELYRDDEEFHSVAPFHVDDIEKARAAMKTAWMEFCS